MRKSFRNYLTLTFSLVILVTIAAIEIASVYSIKRYFYADATNKLKNQAEVNLGFYYRYIDFSKGLENVVFDDGFTFYQYNSGHLELLDLDGNLLLSTIGLTHNYIDKQEMFRALNTDGFYTSIDKFSYNSSKMVTIALPIKYQDNVIGICVFQNSLAEADNAILEMTRIVLTIGLIVFLASVAISYVASTLIVKPINKLRDYSDQLAKGNYNYQYTPTGPEETKQLGESMNYMRDEILKREAVKNEFISNVSHELRTPLTSIKGWAYTLRDESTDRELLNDGLDIIEKESDRLAQMVNDLLDFSRLLNKRVKLDIKKFDLVKFMRDIENQFKPRAISENKNFYLSTDTKTIEIVSDKDKLRQVFINLIDNAFKFTEENGTIKVDLRDLDDKVQICVVDDGDGIPAKDIDHVLEKFYRGETKKSHTGIGLSIVNEIVQMFNGTIKIVSEVGQGTSFIIVLPKIVEISESHEE